MNKLLYLVIINSIPKIGNGHVVENLFPKKMNRDLLEFASFFKIWLEAIRKLVWTKIKFITIINLFFCVSNFFHEK